MSPIALTLICMCVSFALCGIPFGLLVARAQGIDVRKVGSGNIGMTNVARSVGAGAAALTFALDVLKGTVCVLLARALLAYACLGGDWAQTAPQGAYGWSAALVWATCVCGHVFSPYLGFRGGKGISVGLGAGGALLARGAPRPLRVPAGRRPERVRLARLHLRRRRPSRLGARVSLHARGAAAHRRGLRGGHLVAPREHTAPAGGHGHKFSLRRT